jgi:hypothetical protein
LRASVNGGLCPCSEPISSNRQIPLDPEDFPANEDDGC